MLLVDSCIWIEWLRGNDKAKEYLQDVQKEIAISALVMAELMAGARQSNQRQVIVQLQDFYKCIDVDLDIAIQGGEFAMQYYPSHGSGIVDCMLAATAKIHNLTLVTHNTKHFPMLDDIVVPFEK